jgi:uncharacterized membrane protein
MPDIPNLAAFHPQLAHFVIVLMVVGVAFRLVSLTGKLRFTSPAATVLLVTGALFSWVAVRSGTDAHGPVERIPGARDAVVEHEEWGERTRNLFIGIAALELLGLAFMNDRRRHIARYVHIASALAGVVGVAFVYETGEHGGELVFAYGGGVGTRSGEAADVQNLLVAGLYNAAQQDREQGRKEDAARLIEELERRRPNDPGVRLMAIESMLQDRNDAKGALDALRGFFVDDPRLAPRVGLLRVDAFEAAGQPDSARAVMTALQRDFPENARVKARAARLQSGG